MERPDDSPVSRDGGPSLDRAMDLAGARQRQVEAERLAKMADHRRLEEAKAAPVRRAEELVQQLGRQGAAKLTAASIPQIPIIEERTRVEEARLFRSRRVITEQHVVGYCWLLHLPLYPTGLQECSVPVYERSECLLPNGMVSSPSCFVDLPRNGHSKTKGVSPKSGDVTYRETVVVGEWRTTQQGVKLNDGLFLGWSWGEPWSGQHADQLIVSSSSYFDSYDGAGISGHWGAQFDVAFASAVMDLLNRA